MKNRKEEVIYINKECDFELDAEDYLLSETKRTISGALLINPHIKSVEDVEVFKQEEKLNVSCKVFTKYGDIYIKI